MKSKYTNLPESFIIFICDVAPPMVFPWIWLMNFQESLGIIRQVRIDSLEASNPKTHLSRVYTGENLVDFRIKLKIIFY